MYNDDVLVPGVRLLETEGEYVLEIPGSGGVLISWGKA